MISILYPEKDYESADIAIKAQALSNADSNVLYVVPKHYGRNEEAVYKNLEKTNIALFLIYDANQIDSETVNEILYLKKHKKEIYVLIPEGLKLKSNELPKLEEIRYPKGDKKKLANIIENFIETHKSQSSSSSSDASAALIIIILILSVIGLASAITSSKSKKVKL